MKSRKIAESIRAHAETLAGVTDARVNPAAGSLVVSYDVEAVEVEALEDQLERLCLPPSPARNGNGRKPGRYINQATKIGMMTTLATSLAYGYLGNKKAHIRFGTAFVALAGLHMLRYQATLIR